MQEVPRRRTSPSVAVRARRVTLQEVRRRRTSPRASPRRLRDALRGARASLLTGSLTRRAGRRPGSSRRRSLSSPRDTGRSTRRPARASTASRRPRRRAVRRASAPRPSSTASPTTLGPSTLTREEVRRPRDGELIGFERRLARTSGVLHARPAAREDRPASELTAAKWDSGTAGRRSERSGGYPRLVCHRYHHRKLRPGPRVHLTGAPSRLSVPLSHLARVSFQGAPRVRWGAPRDEL